ncbi:MAG: cell division protein FtsZ [Ignavibacteria bacterium]
MIELDEYFERGAKIRVVGVGGGGGNAVNSMIARGLQGVEFFAINTDLQALQRNAAPNKIQIGKNLTRGLGAGSDPTVGHRAVEEDRDEIARALSGSDMVFVTAGMGGGTGTGGAPVVANIAKSAGALVVGCVTRPFAVEGPHRNKQANAGIEELKKHVDTLLVIPNQKLLSVVNKTTPLQVAFDLANEVLYNATRGISEVITVPGFINVDFADVRTIMKDMGEAVMGTGVATGENRAAEAAHKAISSELLEEVSIAGAQGVLVNITGGPNMSLVEVEEATEIVRQAAGEEVNVILGAVVDEKMTDEMMVTVIATGFKRKTTPPVAPGAGIRPAIKAPRLVERIPTGVSDLKNLDKPTFMRRGVNLDLPSVRAASELPPEDPKPTPEDLERPTFLRKIMD